MVKWETKWHRLADTHASFKIQLAPTSVNIQSCNTCLYPTWLNEVIKMISYKENMEDCLFVQVNLK